jgi:hypothetical protein
MIMADERLYRLRSKEGSHFNEKTNEEGWNSAIQFDEENNLQGPLEYQVVDESEYTQVVEVERKQRTFGEVMIEDVVAPALAEAATYFFERAIDAGAEAMKTKVIPAVKTKSVELIDKAKTVHAECKAVKKTSTVVTKKPSKIKAIEILEKEEKKVEHTTKEVDQIVNNMKFAALYIAAGIRELSNTVVVDSDPEKALEMQEKLKELTSEQAIGAINFMLEDKNREMLDQETLQLFEAFRDEQLIIEGERVPINNYISKAANM